MGEIGTLTAALDMIGGGSHTGTAWQAEPTLPAVSLEHGSRPRAGGAATPI